MQPSSKKPPSKAKEKAKAKEKEKPKHSQRDRWIGEARQGDTGSVRKLREGYGITRVWTQEEIDARGRR